LGELVEVDSPAKAAVFFVVTLVTGVSLFDAAAFLTGRATVLAVVAVEGAALVVVFTE
jgi:hypothetical protein